MKPPTSREEVRKFIGVVNYYRGMWKRRSYMLAPLPRIPSNKRGLEWKCFEQDAFDEIKRTVVHYTLLHYPGFNETFKIHTNARAFRL